MSYQAMRTPPITGKLAVITSSSPSRPEALTLGVEVVGEPGDVLQPTCPASRICGARRAVAMLHQKFQLHGSHGPSAED